MAFVAVTTAESDAKSPMDDALWAKIKADLDDLDSRVIAAGSSLVTFFVEGKLKYLTDQKRSVAFGMVNKEFTPGRVRYMLKKSGLSGTMAFDIRKHTMPKTPITTISHQFNAATSSISRKGSALNTQSIARSTAQLSTQSITHAKSASNVQSIVLLGTVDELGASMVQYNLSATIDSDTVVGDSIVMASCTTGANNGTFTIVEKNRGGGMNVVVSNGSGVAQTSAAGTAQLKIMSYNFTNPVSTNFSGSAYFASHTSGNNDGNKTIYGINQGGNNIWVKNSTGVTQGGVAGSADTNIMQFNMGSAVSTTDYIVGEYALTASHSTGANNGSFSIFAVNSGGNNVQLHVSGGAVQGGVAGTVNTQRWSYNLPSDPTAQVTAGDTMYMSGHSTAANNGTFTVKETSASTVTVYNVSGVVQGGSAGNVYTTKKLIHFGSDQSANYTTDSWIEMQGCADSTYNYYYSTAPYKVLEVNRGGGANYNVVIDCPTGSAQDGAAGYVESEMKSIFTSSPSLSSDLTSLEANFNLVGETTNISAAVIAAQTPLLLYITSYMTGDPRDFSVSML